MFRSRRFLLGAVAAVVLAVLGTGLYANHKVQKFHQFVGDVNELALRITSLESAEAEQQKQISELRQIIAANTQSQKPAGPSIYQQPVALTAGRADSSLEMFGTVSPFDRDGLLETYGATLREARQRPIGLSETVVNVTHDTGWVIWSPDFSPSAQAAMLAVDLIEPPSAGALEIGLITADGKVFVFDRLFGPARPSAPNLLPLLVPGEFVEATKNPTTKALLQPIGRSLRAALPESLLEQLAAHPDTAIRHWYVKLDGAAGTSVPFRRVALVQASEDERADTVSISGKVRGGTLEPGAKVQLLDERGHSREETIAADGRFRFDNIERNTPISLRASFLETEVYTTLGRWFSTGVERADISIDLLPHYVNQDNHPPDPKKAKVISVPASAETGAVYQPHSREVWPGDGTIQEYDSTTFTNNMGFVDRDRFFDNPGHCVRLVHLGSSHSVALQVRPFEKFNILMEEELSVALGRCVEVISAGRDNGDIGSNYGSIRDYAIRFHPDAIIIESGSSLILQLHPKLLKEGFGWDYDHSGVGNFAQNTWGELDWRPAASDYALYATKPTFPELVKGVPFLSSLSIPEKFIPQEGKEALDRLEMIVRWLERTHPTERFILQTGVDQAQCRGACLSKLTIGTESVDFGAVVFTQNFRAFCLKNHFECIDPPVPNRHRTPETGLTIMYDGHYSVRGHQWLAHELSAGLLKMRPNLWHRAER